MLADKLEEYRSSEDSLRTVLLGAQKLGRQHILGIQGQGGGHDAGGYL